MSAYSRRGPDPLEQGLDRLVSAGKQLVDGVSGARPGSRPQARGAARRAGSLPRLDELGRWVEDKLDWILEDEDDWREPWQEQPPASASAVRQRRRPLEAISRRSRAAAQMPAAAPATDWPDDDTFTVPRWQRSAAPERLDQPPSSEPPGRPLPRSSRRRSP